MATGMSLGSPAVADNAATPGGWLDQFMQGAAARGYRVNFITVHWYGADFTTGPAVQQLESYLQAIYSRYHLPIWLTEFALTNFGGGSPSFPTESQQAAFLTEQRRCWNASRTCSATPGSRSRPRRPTAAPACSVAARSRRRSAGHSRPSTRLTKGPRGL
jgi:hypothetical protein